MLLSVQCMTLEWHNSFSSTYEGIILPTSPLMSDSIAPFRHTSISEITTFRLCSGIYGQARARHLEASLGTSRSCNSLPRMGTSWLWSWSYHRSGWTLGRYAGSSCISQQRKNTFEQEFLLWVFLRPSSQVWPFLWAQLFSQMGTS